MARSCAIEMQAIPKATITYCKFWWQVTSKVVDVSKR